ncbi:RusA family crossover junction endodeoxyribonuclease [Dubosiella newyorkensis]|uniref:RusA family crossover junction endodeoxyribonuclease n=1 Tax=Dubosiella newyorkensis TaxID=1862672 RepID=UPI0026F3EDD1|nr:RusA family crossover junction endodeoxyribonuclease [Dubosiella newyorkensis]
MIRFEIPGEPGAKGRPWFSTFGGHPTAYTDKKTRLYEMLVRDAYMTTIGNPDPLKGELRVEINAHFGVPKSTSKRKRELMLAGKIRPTKKPDTDNIAKIVLDSLNGIAFEDDKQVVHLIVTKQYAEKPHVEVSIWEESEEES